jgi:tetratricopeptide (TPR) repeat protein
MASIEIEKLKRPESERIKFENKEYSYLINLDNNFLDAYFLRGINYGKQGKLDEAVADFNQALRINPKCKEALNYRGVAYARQGNMFLSIADFNSALAIDPYYTLAFNNHAFAYKELCNKNIISTDLIEMRGEVSVLNFFPMTLSVTPGISITPVSDSSLCTSSLDTPLASASSSVSSSTSAIPASSSASSSSSSLSSLTLLTSASAAISSGSSTSSAIPALSSAPSSSSSSNLSSSSSSPISTGSSSSDHLLHTTKRSMTPAPVTETPQVVILSSSPIIRKDDGKTTGPLTAQEITRAQTLITESYSSYADQERAKRARLQSSIKSR